MHKLKFILLTAAVLLAGALAAGFAARAVVEPRTGQTVSAGVRTVPSVLGQTAEEVLFYPWSMYDTQSLYPVENFSQELTEYYVNILFVFHLMEISFDRDALFQNLLWNVQSDGTINNGTIGIQMFLKDFPAQRHGVPTVISLALSKSPLSISYLVRPAQAVELTQEQQDAALEKVKADLLDFLRHSIGESPFILFEDRSIDIFDKSENELELLLTSFLSYYYAESSFWLVSMENFAYSLEELFQVLWYSGEYVEKFSDLEQTTIEDLQDILERVGCSIQLISTPQQVVVLFHLDSGGVSGVYYDIQLDCYSGLGISY